MKTLIIGGTGLISTAVTQQLIERGDEVTLFNRGRTPSRFAGQAKLLVGDRSDRPAFVDILRQSGRWDCVIDMICSDPEDAAALREGCRNNAGHVLFCSTTNVYPKPADHYPVREDHRLGAAYKNGIDKAACEVLHRQAEDAGDYALTIIRPGHTYGEGGGVLHSLGQHTGYLDRLRQGKPIIVHSDGQGLWSSLHADDVARVFSSAAGLSTAFGKTYNACGTEWLTWNQYHQQVAQALAAPAPELVHIPVDALAHLNPQRANHASRSLQYPGIYDMSAARRDLGFSQQVPFTEGIQRTVHWLDQHDGVEPWDSDLEYEAILLNWEAWRRSITAATATP